MKAKSSQTQAGDAVSFVIEYAEANIISMRRAKGIVLKVDRDNIIVIEDPETNCQQQTWTVPKRYVRRYQRSI